MCVALVVALAARPLFAAGWWSGDGEPPFGKISDDLVTEHIDFASRLDQPLRVFVTAFGIGQREVVELRQRFGYEPVLFPTESRTSANPWETARRTGRPFKPYLPSMDEPAYREKADALLAKLPSCGAILIGRTDPALFPDGDRRKILDRVREGAGLVYVATEAKKVELEGVTLSEISAERLFPVDLVPNLRGLRLYEGMLGKGRVLEIVYRNPRFDIVENRALSMGWLETLTPYESEDPLYYDFCHAFLGKCLWHVTGHRGSEDRADLAKTERTYNEMGLETAADSASAVLRVTQWKTAAGGTVDYRVSDARIAAAERLSVAFEKDAWKPGESIPCRVKVPGAGNLRVSLVDEYGREIFRRDFAAASGELAFDIAFPHQKSRFAQVTATLRRGGNLADEAFAKLYFNTLANDRDDFCFSMWSDHASKSRVSRIGLRQMKAYGVDNMMECFLTYGGVTAERRALVPRVVHEAGLNYSIYVNYTCRGPENKADAHGANCKVFDRWDKFLANGRQTLDEGGKKPRKYADGSEVTYVRLKTYRQDSVAGAKDLGVYFYNLGDENDLAHHGNVNLENCFCGECQKRFRAWLRNLYGTLERMNAEYRSKYASWDEVEALPFVEAAKRRRIPLWVDFRAFMEDQFVNLHLYAKAEVEEIDPGAVIGSEGYVYPHNSFTGYCFYKLLPHFTFGAPYFNDRDTHAVRQYLAPGSTKAAWYGTYESENVPAISRRTPWQYLFAGLDGAFWWYAAFTPKSGAFSNCCIFRPDMTMLEPFAASAKEMDFIRGSGLGKMLHGARPAGGAVAVHYSNPCLHASTVNPGMTTWELSHQDFAAAFNVCSVPYRFLSPPEIERAGGIPATIRVLALPYSQALSDGECGAIRAFVERGGLVLADELPGLMNEHCSVRKANPLAGLFGEPLELKRTGKGAAVLLGDYIRGLDNRLSIGSAGGIAAGVQRYLSLFGVEPAVRVTDDCGSLRPADLWKKDKVLFACLMGPAESLGRMARAGGAESGTRRAAILGDSPVRRLRLAREVCAYDLGEGGRFLGKSDCFDIRLEKTVGRVIAFTGRELTAPELTLSAPSVKPGAAVSCAISEINGCALVSVVGPDGREVFSDRLTSSPATFAPAWNEAKGTYRFRVRSALGGFAVEKAFEVE